MKRPPRERRSDPEVVERIRDLVAEGHGATTIRRVLEADGFGARIPSDRTIGEIVREARATETSEPWSLVDAPGDDVPLVVPVIAAVIEASEGRVRWISKAEASVVARIVRAAPTIPPWDAFRLARRILAEPDAERDVAEYLSFEPWHDPTRYRAAYAARWVRHLLLVDRALHEIQRYETPEEARGEHRGKGEAT